MAIKKGSAAAKAWGRKMKLLRSRKSRSPSIKRKVIKSRKRTMVKRRRVTKRRVSRKRKSTSILGINTMKALAAMLYGGTRSKTSNLIAPYTARLPLGNVSDEAGMLIVTTMAKKYLVKRAGVARDALTAGQTIELARIGEAVASGQLGISLPGISSAESGSGYNFA